MEFVRAATDADVAELVALEDEARVGVAAHERGSDRWLAAHPRLDFAGWIVRLADPGWTVLVAGLDDAVLGFACMRLPVGRPQPVAEIEGIFVSPEARSLGLGELMVERLLDEARVSGAAAVDATALPGDRETKNLFERVGMVARLIVVSRDLGE